MPEKASEVEAREEVLLSFLVRTKQGEYAQIEESSLLYSRVIEETETVAPKEEEFYYTIS